jgi:hypothetical protein
LEVCYNTLIDISLWRMAAGSERVVEDEFFIL